MYLYSSLHHILFRIASLLLLAIRIIDDLCISKKIVYGIRKKSGPEKVHVEYVALCMLAG